VHILWEKLAILVIFLANTLFQEIPLLIVAKFFYFIGMQDNNYAAVNIIQPVLTWGNELFNGVKGWNLASWDCCPSNITTKSCTITGFGAGDQIRGTLQRQDDSTWVIDATIVKSGANTTLVSHVGTYLYDWSDVTLIFFHDAIGVTIQKLYSDHTVSELIKMEHKKIDEYLLFSLEKDPKVVIPPHLMKELKKN